MPYTHVTQEERYQIALLHKQGWSYARIGQALGRSASTIGREIARNREPSGYRAHSAHAAAHERQSQRRNARQFTAADWQHAEAYLRLGLAPQQVSGRLAAEKALFISHESIYQYVYRDKAKGGNLVSYLRCQKTRRKRYGSGRERRGMLKNRIGIEQRAAIVEQRSRLGDWEGDTVIGHGHKGVLLTLVERKSRYTLARELPCREAPLVGAAVIELLRHHKQRCHTLTFDNGKEFAEHEFIAQCLEAKVYFARPYHSWERGTNENTNGLLRQYFPKQMSLLNVTRSDVDDAVYALNQRPRKCLGYRTPHEVFYGLELQPLTLAGVALRT